MKYSLRLRRSLDEPIQPHLKLLLVDTELFSYLGDEKFFTQSYCLLSTVVVLRMKLAQNLKESLAEQSQVNEAQVPGNLPIDLYRKRVKSAPHRGPYPISYSRIKSIFGSFEQKWTVLSFKIERLAYNRVSLWHVFSYGWHTWQNTAVGQTGVLDEKRGLKLILSYSWNKEILWFLVWLLPSEGWDPERIVAERTL